MPLENLKGFSEQTDELPEVRRRPLFVRAAILLVVVLTIAFAASMARRVKELRSERATEISQAMRQEHFEAAKDEKLLAEIDDLTGQVSSMNWELVTPFKEFEAGKIDAATLRKRTAEPEAKILRLCTRMYELANAVEDPTTRDRAVNVHDDEARLEEGAKLFEEGRNKAIAAAIALSDADTPQAAHLQRLLDAYEPRE
jgi:hypothetical protein